MSVLVIGDAPETETVVRFLIAEGDQVGVIEADRKQLQRWASIGAYAALGDAEDPDLVERCATQARTIVVFESPGPGGPNITDVLRAVLHAGQMLPAAPRLVMVSQNPSLTVQAQLNSAALDYIVLRTGLARGLLRRGPKAIPADKLAEAVNAADDLAGEPRLDLDLARRSGWEALRLEPGEFARD
jgi:TrkA-N domain